MKREERFIIKMKNFSRLKNELAEENRLDTYFSSYRLRRYTVKGETKYYLIPNIYCGMSVKKKREIKKFEYDFRIKHIGNRYSVQYLVDIKRPYVEGIRLYVEKIHLGNGECIYSSEYGDETCGVSRNEYVSLLRKIPGVEKVISKGNMSLRDIVKRYLSDHC